MKDREKEIKYEIYLTNEEIRQCKKKLLLLKQELLNIQGTKHIENEMKLRKKK